MTEFLNIDDVADDRGEESAKVARMLTRKECKLYLDLRESEDPILCRTRYLNEKGNLSIYQVRRGVYPMTLEAQHKYVRSISGNNFDLTELHFISGDDNRLIYLHAEDRTVKVVVKKSDIDLLPKLTVVSKKVSTSKATGRKGKTNPELHKIFWRAFVFLRDEDGLEPQYKQVWQVIYDDVAKSTKNETLAEHRQFDPKEHIETIDPVGLTQTTKLCWLIATAGGEVSDQGSYILHSLPKLLNRLKNSPPQI